MKTQTKKHTTKDKTKGGSLDERYKENLTVYEYWVKNPSMSMISVCDKFKISDSKLRAWMKTHDKTRPDEEFIRMREERYQWIIKAYNKGLEEDLSAREVANWAEKESGRSIQRGEVQHYAAKFDLPLLREHNDGITIGLHSKYA